MSYDSWKTTEPDQPCDGPFGQCDCCNEQRPLSQCWASGVETWACDECRGDEGDDDDVAIHD